MELKGLYKKQDIRSYRDVIRILEMLEKEKGILHNLKKQIIGLKRGEIKKEDTLNRAKIARHFTENAQLLIYALHKHGRKKEFDQIISRLMEIKNAGELILRENPTMQTKSPIDILKWEDMPIRYAINLNGTKELRKGFGLHTKPLNEMGLSVTVAFMPKNYSQLYHHHPLSEYSLNFDARILGKYKDQGSEKILKVGKEQIAYFDPNTIHKLINQSTMVNRNVSIKSRAAILKWKPYYFDKINRIGLGKVIKDDITPCKDYNIKSYKIRDSFYDYTIKIFKIRDYSTVRFSAKSPIYLYVIGGKIKVKYFNKAFKCSDNDIIVADPETRFSIMTKTKSRLYSVVAS